MKEACISCSFLTMSVNVEDGALGDDSLEVVNLVIRCNKRADDEGGADDCEIKREEQRREGKENHGGGTGNRTVVQRSSAFKCLSELGYKGWWGVTLSGRVAGAPTMGS